MTMPSGPVIVTVALSTGDACGTPAVVRCTATTWSSCRALSTACTTIVDVVDCVGVVVTQAAVTNTTDATSAAPRSIRNVHADRRQEREIPDGQPHRVRNPRAA